MITLKDWQKKAMNAIYSTINKSGQIEAETGSGKSIIGFKLIEDNPRDRFLIVVPTIALQKQWADEVVKFNVADSGDICFIGGGHAVVPNKRITIAVINSLRNVNWNHSLAQYDWCIVDEVHRSASDTNIKFLQNGKFKHIVGLTATKNRPDGRDILLDKLIGPVVYKVDDVYAKNEGYVSEYEVVLEEVIPSKEDYAKYVDIDSNFKMMMSLFNNNYNSARNLMIQKKWSHPLFKEAVKLMKLVQERKSFVCNLEVKSDKAVELCTMNNDKKIILFDESKDNANKIYRKLKEKGFDPVLYHSGITKKKREEAIVKFKSSESKILVTVKALDEGLDVKDAQIGIVVNGNSQQRQIKQRLGRILRKDGDKLAKLYMIYVPGTVDEKYIDRRIKFLGAANSISGGKYGNNQEIEEFDF